MVPWQLIDSTPIPGSSDQLQLHKRGEEYSIRLHNRELMNSRVHGSEEALAELACARIAHCRRPRLLIGGLGMGYTLRAALAGLTTEAQVVVAELVPGVVAWNREVLAVLAGHPLRDRRVTVHQADIRDILDTSDTYDAILLDIDNGPETLIRPGNQWIYSAAGLAAAGARLRRGGVLAIWSAAPSQPFHRRLQRAGFEVEKVNVRARGRHGGGQTHTIWIAQRRDNAGNPRIASAPSFPRR